MAAVELESVSKLFRQRSLPWLSGGRGSVVRAVDGVSLAVAPGQVQVLLGPNGSGKTTLLKLVSTVLLPDSGRVLVHGTDAQLDPDQVRRNVAFAIAHERSFFQRLTARENLEFFAAMEEVPRRERAQRISRAMEQTGITEVQDTLAYKLSSGMCQRLGIARAILKEPSVLLLDEPTRSIDPGGAARFWELVRRLAAGGATVLLATHNFAEAIAVGDAVAVLQRGLLAAQRRLDQTTSVEELRSFYFTQVEAPSVAMSEAQ